MIAVSAVDKKEAEASHKCCTLEEKKTYSKSVPAHVAALCSTEAARTEMELQMEVNIRNWIGLTSSLSNEAEEDAYVIKCIEIYSSIYSFS